MGSSFDRFLQSAQEGWGRLQAAQDLVPTEPGTSVRGVQQYITVTNYSCSHFCLYPGTYKAVTAVFINSSPWRSLVLGLLRNRICTLFGEIDEQQKLSKDHSPVFRY